MCRNIQNLGHKICVGLYKHSDKKCVRLCTVYMYIHAYRGADAELVVDLLLIEIECLFKCQLFVVIVYLPFFLTDFC